MRLSAVSYHLTCPRGLEELLVAEVEALGGADVRAHVAGVGARGDLELGYRLCLWSRLANRVLLHVASFPAASPEALYAGVRGVNWSEHVRPDGTIAVDFTATQSAVAHTHFGALKVKDAIVDQFRLERGRRPGVDTGRPEVRVNVHVHRDVASLSVDLAGEPLHRRGYRERSVAAPLKENLAAAILLRAGWPELAALGRPFVDPMCGSGTLPIEAALMAGDIAPGSLRDYFGFIGWMPHHPPVWAALKKEAGARREAGLARLPLILGCDRDARAVRAAQGNAERAGLGGRVRIEERDITAAAPPAGSQPGLVALNPPYGERVGRRDEIGSLYRTIGRTLGERFSGYRAAVLVDDLELGKRTGLKAVRRNKLYNGPIECALLHFDLTPVGQARERERRATHEEGAGAPERTARQQDAGARDRTTSAAPARANREPPGAGAEMLANRLRKDLKKLGAWARREGITCWRLYDADIPEYAVAIDLYEGFAHVQEYAPPADIDPTRAGARMRDVRAVVPEVLELPRDHVFYKVRERQRGKRQYQKVRESGRTIKVREGGHTFLVNLSDYLDTGLFLDHRPTRRLIGELAQGRRFLNLFAYTGTATVYAARGGAVVTTSVDMSRTYTEWAERNLRLNDVRGRNHQVLRADCASWVEQHDGRYGLIFLDPPTHSRSKRMQEDFDLQRDHVRLLAATARLLEPGGVLIFSNNFRRFRMAAEELPQLVVEEITAETIPPDFARNPRIHNCWRITARG